MIEELVGYVSSNIKRKQIIDVLEKNGSDTADHLAKVTRIPRISLEKMLDEMIERDMIKKDNEKYSLTETGDQVVNVTRSLK
ncbi:hypothetical protein CUJ83_00430 [Methanocella sp. CWC-04]|uniref:ArnR1-like winged helix-turn-helix domain-containing protein n=1 Tax=Methanooceanicella nereidis TaxID=2052831 RepID=A0AAP2RBX7_9EURY|nr:winged helix-turn-helix domain-containing protein [Methanocella sp. CWC-04]MCD1293462.1 hypothetical protein [Methanocella sp. CWC-04]